MDQEVRSGNRRRGSLPGANAADAPGVARRMAYRSAEDGSERSTGGEGRPDDEGHDRGDVPPDGAGRGAPDAASDVSRDGPSRAGRHAPALPGCVPDADEHAGPRPSVAKGGLGLGDGFHGATHADRGEVRKDPG